ncbi:hypothetical protein [Spirochaeta isovalerica]|uniref:Type II secretory pathway component GspD/PulD (Secretin) n=1 Tax=Spirochaeta isovalerica TaxID=150 RepID=A0A841R0L7_9SPIO|nr:hypothetical protein [Spirochaeta isovalerica]MBB6478484.1 type II secretory pathway component GspD/PulD (secretin) [Spirochaeta isovalerica]
MHNKKSTLLLLLLFFAGFALFAQHIDSIEFRNQEITDILMVLAQSTGHSIIPDETVTGQASYYFDNIEFETALSLFLSTYNYYYYENKGIYYVSRIKLDSGTEEGTISIHAEDTDIQLIIRSLSRQIGQTILFDALPRENISIHGDNLSPEEILNIVIRKYSDYHLEKDNGFFYVRRESPQSNGSRGGRRTDLFSREGEFFSSSFEQIRFREALTSLFNLAGFEYSFLGRNDSIIESFDFTGKSFDQMLRLLLQQGNGDYKVIDGIYYIIDIERKDVLKKFYTTIYLPLAQTAVSEIISLIPTSIGSSQNIKTDKNNNALILSGTLEEVAPIEEFVSMIDSRDRDMVYHRFQLNHIEPASISSLIPKEMLFSQPQILEDSNSFIMQLPPAKIVAMETFLELIDVNSPGFPIELKYIKGEDLLENPPPSVRKEELIATNNPNILFYKGSETRYHALMRDLELLDRPTPQIRYEVLVMQIQEADKENWDINFGNSVTADDSSTSLLGSLGNVLNLNFDIVSQFGYQFALDLNWSMENSESKVMADTTLNALSGESTNFQNTETYRYQELEVDADTGETSKTGVTREITSGLMVEIEGWASGDGMITMDVQTTISKRDDTSSSSSSSIPTTTERSVNTHIRTQSGKPVIIGGLMQKDRVIGKQKTPFFGDIPLLGKLFRSDVESWQDTEMVVTIVPYLEYPEYSSDQVGREIESLYDRFIRR